MTAAESAELERYRGELPVRAHLRPKPLPSSRGWCPVYHRLRSPAERPTWRNYDCNDCIPVEIAAVMPILGEA